MFFSYIYQCVVFFLLLFQEKGSMSVFPPRPKPCSLGGYPISLCALAKRHERFYQLLQHLFTFSGLCSPFTVSMTHCFIIICVNLCIYFINIFICLNCFGLQTSSKTNDYWEIGCNYKTDSICKTFVPTQNHSL